MMDTRTVRMNEGKNQAAQDIEKERQRKFLVQIQQKRMLVAAQILQASDEYQSSRSILRSTAAQNESHG